MTASFDEAMVSCHDPNVVGRSSSAEFRHIPADRKPDVTAGRVSAALFQKKKGAPSKMDCQRLYWWTDKPGDSMIPGNGDCCCLALKADLRIRKTDCLTGKFRLLTGTAWTAGSTDRKEGINTHTIRNRAHDCKSRVWRVWQWRCRV